MPIDYSKLRNVTTREIIRALRRDGFVLDRQRGSHQQYLHPEDGRLVTVAYHRPGGTFSIGTLKAMIEGQAQWTEEDLKRLKLLK